MNYKLLLGVFVTIVMGAILHSVYMVWNGNAGHYSSMIVGLSILFVGVCGVGLVGLVFNKYFPNSAVTKYLKKTKDFLLDLLDHF